MSKWSLTAVRASVFIAYVTVLVFTPLRHLEVRHGEYSVTNSNQAYSEDGNGTDNGICQLVVHFPHAQLLVLSLLLSLLLMFVVCLTTQQQASVS